MSAELQTVLFMGVVLKIPVAAMFWIVWWALRNRVAPAEAPEDDGHDFKRFRRQPNRPRGPRRGGPHPPAAPSQAPLPSSAGAKHERRWRVTVPEPVHARRDSSEPVETGRTSA